MTESTDNAVPEIVPTFRLQWEEVQNCHVLLYPEGMIKLSGSAGVILKRVDGKKSISDIIEDLQNQFPEADIADDVRKFLEVAHDNGWIRTANTK